MIMMQNSDDSEDKKELFVQSFEEKFRPPKLIIFSAVALFGAV